MILAALVVLGSGWLAGETDAAHAASTLQAADAFGRNVTDSWGSADQGGSYTLKGAKADFDVANSVGTMLIRDGKRRTAYLRAVRLSDTELNIRVRTNKPPEGGAQYLDLIARRTTSRDSYIAHLSLLTDRTVRVQLAQELDGHRTPLGAETLIPNLTLAPNQFLRVKFRVRGAYPTKLRVRIWADSAPEPKQWQLKLKDNTAALQQSGSIGLAADSASTTTNRPLLISFDDLQVKALSGATTNQIYWGAIVHGRAPSPDHMAPNGVFDTFEKNAGKKMSILHWGQPWKMNQTYQPFQTAYFDDVRAHGSIPYLDWGTWNLGSGINQPNFQLADVYNGAHDTYIIQWAKQAKAWGHPFFLRLDWEMNGNWQFPWSEQLNGNKPGDYIKMWRHVHDLFTANGVKNVTWVWCPNIAGDTTTPFANVYPGDAYVDWVCLDGYNKYSTWLTFNQVFAAQGINWLHNSYAEITALAPTKPLMLGEFASLEAGDGGANKAAWIRDALLTQLPQHFPKIKAVVWFNWNDGVPDKTFPIESTNASVNAFKQGIQSSYYAANDYSGLNISPIPPP